MTAFYVMSSVLRLSDSPTYKVYILVKFGYSCAVIEQEEFMLQIYNLRILGSNM